MSVGEVNLRDTRALGGFYGDDDELHASSSAIRALSRSSSAVTSSRKASTSTSS
jgi:hypothetical protein